MKKNKIALIIGFISGVFLYQYLKKIENEKDDFDDEFNKVSQSLNNTTNNLNKECPKNTLNILENEKFFEDDL